MVIDVEGAEAQALSGLDLQRWRPWVLVVEATRPNSTEPSHEAWERYLTEAGYSFCLFDGLSRFYVAAEHREALEASLSYPACVFDHYIPRPVRAAAARRRAPSGRGAPGHPMAAQGARSSGRRSPLPRQTAMVLPARSRLCVKARPGASRVPCGSRVERWAAYFERSWVRPRASPESGGSARRRRVTGAFADPGGRSGMGPRIRDRDPASRAAAGARATMSQSAGLADPDGRCRQISRCRHGSSCSEIAAAGSTRRTRAPRPVHGDRDCGQSRIDLPMRIVTHPVIDVDTSGRSDYQSGIHRVVRETVSRWVQRHTSRTRHLGRHAHGHAVGGPA